VWSLLFRVLSPPATSLALAASLVCVGAARGQQPVEFSPAELARIRQHSPLGPVPDDPTNAWADDPDAAAFGQRLFFDERVSRDGDRSCATCHVPDLGFTDGRVVAEGVAEGPRHTPSVWNAGYQRWYFWDGRADTLWGQALQPIENPLELAGSRTAIAHLVLGDPALRAEYEAIFGPAPADLLDGLPLHARPAPAPRFEPDAADAAWRALAPETRGAVDTVFARIGKAIAAYERRLVSRRAPLDVFVEGLSDDDPEKLAALSASAQRGLKLFVGEAGCRLCHSGPAFTDGEFHNLSLPLPPGRSPGDSGRLAGIRRLRADPFNSAGPHSDAPDGRRAARLRRLVAGGDLWGQFQTPSLRNVARTPPYMHAGQFETLADVLDFYDTLAGQTNLGHHQEQVLTPLRLTERERTDLLAFLHSLTDEDVDPALLSPP